MMSNLDSAYHFARCLRMIVVMVCRGAALVFILLAVVSLVANGYRYYNEYRPLVRAGMMQPSAAHQWIYPGVEEFVFGILLALFATLMARWLVPAPKHTCLRCGYSTEKLTKPICPECGAPVPVDREAPEK